MATKKSAKKSGAKKSAKKAAAKKSGAKKAGISLPGLPPNFACISSCLIKYRLCVKTATDKVSCQKKLIACIDKCLL
ncbi:MAG TPA: hypothetical protein VF240_10165 [Pyrinomonadaceae bacterium]